VAGQSSPVEIGREYGFDWPTFPNDFVFGAGHRIGIVLVGNYTSFNSIPGTIGSRITLDTRASKVRLPIVGGYGAALASGGFTR
jgi:X-Pro dipeptidyl-peptidase